MHREGWGKVGYRLVCSLVGLVLGVLGYSLFLQPEPTNPVCEYIITGRYQTDRTLYLGGGAKSRWPVEFWFKLEEPGTGRNFLYSLGNDDYAANSAAIAEPGSVYNICYPMSFGVDKGI